MAFYKNEREYRLLKVINASEIRAVAPVDFKRVGLSIGIVTAERTVYIRAPSQDETYAWIEDINRMRCQHDASGLVQPIHALHLRNEPRRGTLRTDTAPMAFSRSEQGASAPITIAARSATVPPISIQQVCDDMQTGATVLSSSPTSTLMLSTAGSSGRLHRAETQSVRWQATPLEGTDVRSASAPEPVYPVEEARPVPPHLNLASSSEEEGDAEDECVPAMPQSSPTEDVNRIIAQGYLMKQGARRRQWRKRWFVLTVNTLYYAHSHMDARAHRSFPMSMILDVMECEPSQGTSQPFSLRSLSSAPIRSESSHLDALSHPEAAVQSLLRAPVRTRMDHCFKIVTPKRTLMICAPTEEEEIKWLSAFQTILNRQRSAPMARQRSAPGSYPRTTRS